MVHATVEPTLKGALAILRERGFSYHFLIDRDGSATQCVSPVDAAFHAGQSKGPQGAGVNEYSVGISFVNLNDGVDPFTSEQIQSAVFVAKKLKSAFPNLRYVTSHEAISPGRKDDPSGFPMQEFATLAELEVWP